MKQILVRFVLFTVFIWLMLLGLFTLRDAWGQQTKTLRPTDPPQIDEPSPPLITPILPMSPEEWAAIVEGAMKAAVAERMVKQYEVYLSPDTIVTIWALTAQFDCDGGVLQFRGREGVPVAEFRAAEILGWKRATEE